MLFKRKHEFKPDKTNPSTLNMLFITKKQRRAILRWLLLAAVLTVVCVLQDVLLSRVRIYGGAFDLMAAALLLTCILQDPEIGSIFILVASGLYYFSGSSPGPITIALLTFIGVLAGIIRHCYLQSSFGSALLCTGVSLLVYEAALFGFGLFMDYTTFDQALGFLASAGISLAATPLLYPILVAIVKSGGASWND